MKGENLIKYYSLIEVEDLINELKNSDFRKITKKLDLLGCEARTNIPSFDILQSVIEKVYIGRRNWPRGLDPITCLYQKCRSEIHSAVLISKIAIVNKRANNYDEEKDHRSFYEYMLDTTPAENIEESEYHADNEALVDKIKQQFFKDETALCVIKQMHNEKTKRDIMSFCKITENQYLYARERIKYKLRIKYPKRFPNRN